MKSNFEDRLMEEQADMIDICLEYVQRAARENFYLLLM